MIAFVIVGSFFMTMISIPSNAGAAPESWVSSTSSLGTGSGAANNPQIATDNNGNAVVVWQQLDGAHTRIFANCLSAGVWGTAKMIDIGTGDASSPQVVMDNNGNAIAVWQQVDCSGHQSIYSNRLSAGVWGTAHTIETEAGEAKSPQIAMSSNGNAMVVWVQNDSDSHPSAYAAGFSGGVWMTPKLLECGTGDVWSPQVAMDSCGNAMVVWSQLDSLSHMSVYARHFSSGAWGEVTLLANAAGDVQSPKVAMDGNGNAMVVWSQTWWSIDDWQLNGIYADRFSSGAWGTPKQISESDNDFSYNSPEIVMNSKGDAAVIWEKGFWMSTVILSGTTFASGIWSPVVDLTGASEVMLFDWQVVIDNDDNILVVWSESYTDFDNDIRTVEDTYYARYHAGVWGSNIKLMDNVAPELQIAMDVNGEAIAVWGGSSIFALRFIPGASGTVELLEYGSGYASKPQVAAAINGNAVVVWQQYDGAHDSIYARMYVAGVWGPVVLLEYGTGNAWSPQVAMDREGNAVVVWQQFDDSSHLNLYARYFSSGTWGEVTLLEYGTGNAWSPQVAMDDNGNAMVVWSQYDCSSHLSIYARYFSSGAWGAVALLEYGTGNAWSPQVAMDGNGNAMAVWSQLDSLSHMSVYAMYFSSETWGEVMPLKTGAGDASCAQVAMDGNGNAMVVWSQTWWPTDGGQELSGIYSDRFSSGTWGTPQLLENNSANNYFYDPRIAMDGNGDATVVWLWRASLDIRAVHAIRYESGVWSAMNELANVFGGISSAQVAMDDNGNAMVVCQYDGVWESIIASLYAGGTWEAVVLEHGAGDASNAQVAMDGNCKAMVVWQQDDGAHESIYGTSVRLMTG
ncbi:MAG TPA: hypothetical protein VGK23_12905 [Methanomassiliicoccales archaeon]|jgi:hypothetical protein